MQKTLFFKERMAFSMKKTCSNELQLFAQELQQSVSPQVLEELARKEGFVRRSSKFGAKELVALCVWISQQVASTPLTHLCSSLETSTEVLMSPEGLNQRFNESAVDLLKQVLSNLLTKKMGAEEVVPNHYDSFFSRIRILDSTTFQLPDPFASDYQGSGGSSHTAGVKIQLEYDLLSGQFLHVHSGEGRENDKTFGSTSLHNVRKKDLFLRDLGYFDLNDLLTIHEKGAYYISRLKVNTRVYIENEAPEYYLNGKVKKGSLYTRIDMEEIMNQLQPGETYEITEAYIGSNHKLRSRVIIHRLTEEQTEKRLKDQETREKKKGITYKERSKRLSALNVYIINAPTKQVPMNQVHDLYSLRWQIEILFKTWKSFFKINKCKEIKKERLECHLYGQLISILLCSSTMFQMRQLLLKKKKCELSEYKAIYIIMDYYPLLHKCLQQRTEEIVSVLKRLFHLLEKLGRKCHRYEKKTVFDILRVVYQSTMSQENVAA